MALNENAKQWIRALRSGKYKQTRGALHKGEGFCCLGVACDLAVQAGVVRTVKKDGMEVGVAYDGLEVKATYDGCIAVLPPRVMKWLRLRTPNGMSRSLALPSLTKMNDQGKSFSEIADFIEQHPNELFQEEDA